MTIVNKLSIMLEPPSSEFLLLEPRIAVGQEKTDLEERREKARQWMREKGIIVLGDTVRLERRAGN